MEEQGLISIIIPCFNCEKEISRCIDSIISQNYNSIEIITVDDGSTDKTPLLLDQYACKDDRIVVLHKTNSGPGAARNLGLDNAKGEFIAFVDSDDYAKENIYSRLVGAMQENNVDIVICNYYNSYPDGNLERYNHCLKGKYGSKKEIKNGIIRQFYDGDYTGLSTLWNKLYKRELIERYNIRFDESLYRGEDWWFNITIYQDADAIFAINDTLYCYWQGSTNNLMKKMYPSMYDEWKKSRCYLTEMICSFSFDLDMNVYYKQLLMNIHSLLIRISDDRNQMKRILTDDYYNSIIQYDSQTSRIVRTCHWIHCHSIFLEILFYKVLSFGYRIFSDLRESNFRFHLRKVGI